MLTYTNVVVHSFYVCW